jgi:methanogenesis imperfect marker protein 11
MENIPDPYSISYPEIAAIASEDGAMVELIETFDCSGGAMWAGHHYQKSPLVKSVRMVGNTQRYLLSPGCVDLELVGSHFPAGISGVNVVGDEIAISYLGMGGGGVGASVCRSTARGVIRCTTDPWGGGRLAGCTIWLPKHQRVLIGIDDTDTPEEGATWTLAHNIARAVEDTHTRYLSHTIVQLFPVPYRTKNCVSIVCEFATTEPERLSDRFMHLLERHTLSDDTGMAVFSGFDPQPLQEFGWKVKKGEVTTADLSMVEDHVDIRMAGRGIIGAVAALPFYTRFDEALKLCVGSS